MTVVLAGRGQVSPCSALAVGCVGCRLVWHWLLGFLARVILGWAYAGQAVGGTGRGLGKTCRGLNWAGISWLDTG